MDAQVFDRLTKSLLSAGSRRGVLGWLSIFPLGGGLAALLGDDVGEAKGRRKRRKKAHKHGKGRHKHKKHQPKCKAHAKTKTCAGKCGSVKNNCKKTVDCGPCDCDPPCDACEICTDDLTCEPCEPCCDDVCCTQANAVCHAETGACCVPDSKAQTCNNQCGDVVNNCGVTVDCGDCDCDGGCPPGQVCRSGGCSVACGGNFCLAANEICVDDVCQTCTVNCPDGSCGGETLQAALDEGGTVYVCPGRYRGGFTIGNAVTVIGAGEDSDAANNTILDGQNAVRVVSISDGTGAVTLERLRLTRGRGSAGAGGVSHGGTTLQMRDCTVTGNTSTPFSGGGLVVSFRSTLDLTRCTISDNRASDDSLASGGGIANYGTTTLTDCLVEGNRAAGTGGGINHFEGLTTLAGSTTVRDNRVGTFSTSFGGGILVNRGTLVIAETCRVTENTAPAGRGGGIYNSGGTVTLLGNEDPSPIVVDNCVENCAGPGGVAKCAAGGLCP